MSQIAALEIEIAKITRSLEQARTTYSSLQRQYQEQCCKLFFPLLTSTKTYCHRSSATSEKYRDELRQREELVRNLREAGSLHELESAKFSKERESYESRILGLETELAIAQQAHVQLDEQKQENLLLKETIDRVRFEMDEMRNSAMPMAGGSGTNSGANTFTKSLGAELMGKMKGEWGMEADDDDMGEQDADSSIQVKGEEEEIEGEDVIQTIITRKKRVRHLNFSSILMACLFPVCGTFRKS
jgi:hypothetical protein